MMVTVIFGPGSVPDSEESEIRELLLLLATSTSKPQVRSDLRRVVVLRRLTGGYGDKQVFEVKLIERGEAGTLEVVKIGRPEEIRTERDNYRAYLREESSCFIPVRRCTLPDHSVSTKPSRRREALAYAHAEGWAPGLNLTTLEELAQHAISERGDSRKEVNSALLSLFQMTGGVLYNRGVFLEEGGLGVYWNRRLGSAATIEAECLRDEHGEAILGNVNDSEWTSKVLTGAECPARGVWQRNKDPVGLGARVSFPAKDWTLTSKWLGGELYAELKAEHDPLGFRRFRIEVNPDQKNQLQRNLPNGHEFSIYGNLKELREAANKVRMRESLEELDFEDGVLSGPGASVPDPFDYLHDALNQEREVLPLSLAHGDLNPRNILIRGSQPYLIDYEHVGYGQPILMDFVWLEVTLAMRILPPELNWRQHVRLQRLLAAYCRVSKLLGKRAEPLPFLITLGRDDKRLAAAFRILSTIRTASIQVYPNTALGRWYYDYLANLLIMAHVALKWREQTVGGLRAVAAIGGVAVEAANPEMVAQSWTEVNFEADAVLTLRTLHEAAQRRKESGYCMLLFDLRAAAGSLTRLRGRSEGSLRTQFESVRDVYVRGSFRVQASGELAGQKVSKISPLKAIRVKPESLTSNLEQAAAEQTEDAQMSGLAEELHHSDSEGEGEVFSLLGAHHSVVLLGDAGAGKSTVAREWFYRLCWATVGGGSLTPIPRLPILFTGSALIKKLPALQRSEAYKVEDLVHPVIVAQRDRLRAGGAAVRSQECIHGVLEEALLDIGAFYLIIDGLNEMDASNRATVAQWIRAFGSRFPLTPVLVCHRRFNYVPSLLPDFPLLQLFPLKRSQVDDYVGDRLAVQTKTKVSDLQRLLKSPRYSEVSQFVRIPWFLGMTVDFYLREERLPRSRGELLDYMTRLILTSKLEEPE